MFIGYPNTSNFVKNTPLCVVFSTLFSVFGYPDETLSLVFDILFRTLAVSGAATIYLLNGAGLCVNPTAPADPFTLALFCSCAWSIGMLEKVFDDLEMTQHFLRL